MSFVEQNDVLETFEGMLKHLLKKFKDVTVGPFKRISYQDAVLNYGTDKPDIRFEMKLKNLRNLIFMPIQLFCFSFGIKLKYLTRSMSFKKWCEN